MTRFALCCTSVAATALLLSAGTVSAQASLTMVPSGLNPGDTYQLVFVTSGVSDASSYYISNYDTFVNAQADLGGIGPTSFGVSGFPISWTAIASTEEEPGYAQFLVPGGAVASSHALVTSPVYNLNGVQVATGYTDMWDGTLDAPIQYDQTDAPTSFDVWTGSNSTGSQFNPLGGVSNGSEFGSSSQSDSTWISQSVFPVATPLHLYALSSPLTVPGVPEPSTFALGIAGAAGLAVFLWRRRRSR